MLIQSRFKFITSTALASVIALSCSSPKKELLRQPDQNDSAQVTQTQVNVNSKQKANLSTLIESVLEKDVYSFLTSQLQPAEIIQHKDSIQELSGVTAKLALQNFNSKSSLCLANVENKESALNDEVFSCLASEALASSLSNKNEANLNPKLNAVIYLLNDRAVLSKIDNLKSSLRKSLGSIKSEIDILVSQKISYDMPFVSENFLSHKKFVLTTSYSQGSVGSDRAFNLDSLMVYFEVNNNRVVLRRSPEGLFDGETEIAEILNAFPIVKTSVLKSGEKFYQVDFSSPQNKEFLLPFLGNGNSQLKLNADIIIPKILHTRKEDTVAEQINSGLYFDKLSPNLVIENTVLLNANSELLSPGSETPAFLLGKNVNSPTVRVVQGLFPLPENESSSDFYTNQALSVQQAADSLYAASVENNTEGKDVPFFTSSSYLPNEYGRPRNLVSNIRKFNTSKDIVWVISKNTPEAMVPAMKSAVLSFKKVFEKLTPEGKPATKILVYSEAEFLEKNPDIVLPTGVTAADPRANFIFWDDSEKLGSAWATASAHPFSGEVYSADVMLSGNIWAKNGCLTYYRNLWTADKDKGSPKRPNGAVPSALTRYLWKNNCELSMLKLGVYRKIPDTSASQTFSLTQQASLDLGMEIVESDLVASTLTPERALLIANRLAVKLSNAQGGSQGASSSQIDLQAQLRLELNKNNIDSIFIKNSKNSVPADIFSAVKESVSKRAASSLKQQDEKAQYFNFQSPLGATLAKSLDCFQVAKDPLSLLEFNEYGDEKINLENVTSPEQGAIAMVRATLIHELGHTFGMRHNFMGSVLRSEMPEKPTFPVNPHTDSVMDYNNYTIDLFMGGMKDYEKAESAAQIADLGMYDVLQLATAYKLNTKPFEVKVGPAFCTDTNVGNDNNCQRYDLGKDFKEFMLLDANRTLEKLRWMNILDNILEVQTPYLSSNLGRFSTYSQQLGNAFINYQNKSASDSEINSKVEFARIASMIFNGTQDTQGLFEDYKPQYKTSLKGLKSFLKLQNSFFADEAYGPIIGDIVREYAAVGIVGAAEAYKVNVAANSNNPDSAYLGAILNLNDTKPENQFKDILIDIFASKAMVKQGKKLGVLVFNGTVSNNVAQLNGEKVKIKLTEPFFNHQQGIVIVPEIEVDDIQNPGKTVKLPGAIRGTETIDSLIFNVAMAAYVSGGGKSSDSVKRLMSDLNALKSQLKKSSCEDKTENEICVKISAEAQQAAEIMVNEYQKAIVFAENSQKI
jgi:Met-zincin